MTAKWHKSELEAQDDRDAGSSESAGQEARAPAQTTNAFLEAPVDIREVGVYANDGSGQEFLFARSYLIGGDTVHIHDMAVALTTAQKEAVSFPTTERQRVNT